jgi:hypothetical protein
MKQQTKTKESAKPQWGLGLSLANHSHNPCWFLKVSIHTKAMNGTDLAHV